MKEENNVVTFTGRKQFTDALIELLRARTQDLIQQAVEAKLNKFLQQFTGRTLSNGHLPISPGAAVCAQDGVTRSCDPWGCT